jgi:UMF1 family MFS transporter
MIWCINVERGRSEGEKLAEVIEGFKLAREESGGGGGGGGGRERDSDEESRAILDAYDDETDR